uniref:Uncharacterized protein n=1 Tax=Quercus lobata TaxID=97700 RepID=A0A7N2KZP6_QUELO
MIQEEMGNSVAFEDYKFLYHLNYCVFASAFSDFRRKLFDLNVDDKYLWAQALTGLQTSINSEIRNLYSTGRFTVLKELEAVNTSVKKLYPMIQDGVDF